MTLLRLLYPSIPLRAKLRGFLKRSGDNLPPTSLNYVGNPNYVSGHGTFNHLTRIGGMRPDDSILDIGCGNGRVAMLIKDFLSEQGSYRGFDIVKSGIDWCNANIASEQMRFTCVDVYNLLYNPNGRIQSNELTFPYRDELFTFVFANSVFTHMLPNGMRQYLKEIRRVSKQGMRGYLTFFLLNESSIAMHETGRAAHRFPHCFDGYRTLRKRIGREGMVAYEEQAAINAIKDAGLEIEGIKYGSWSTDNTVFGDENGLFQDVILVRRP